jgi:hypothetical protein
MDEGKKGLSGMTDQEVLVSAVQEAIGILSAYIEPGKRDCEATMNEMIKTLDNRRVQSALERMSGKP